MLENQKYAIVIGSGRLPTQEDIQLIADQGFLAKGLIINAIGGRTWSSKTEGEEQAYMLWAKYKIEQGIKQQENLMEQLEFPWNKSKFFLVKPK